MMVASRAIGFAPRSSSSRPPNMSPHWAAWASMLMAPAMVAATVEIRTSRLRTWESSWASTPSSSASFMIRRMPSVTATAACCGLRPVAKAFGWGDGMK
jgi:hypothetical protein